MFYFTCTFLVFFWLFKMVNRSLQFGMNIVHITIINLGRINVLGTFIFTTLSKKWLNKIIHNYGLDPPPPNVVRLGFKIVTRPLEVMLYTYTRALTRTTLLYYIVVRKINEQEHYFWNECDIRGTACRVSAKILAHIYKNWGHFA